jgi:DNA-binding LacI/PurR family transcriptional regulator
MEGGPAKRAGTGGERKVTSADVARVAGVSQSAVSRVFTPGASASRKTAEKVRAAADALGYRPDPLARAMSTGRTRIIGLVIAYLENMFYPVVLERLSRALKAQGYRILVFMTDQAGESVDEVMRDLIDHRVDGIVTASVGMTDALTARCVAAGIPVVMFNRGQDDPRLTEVTSDNLAGAARVAEFLMAGGHARIAHVAGWQGSSTGRDRAEGFRRTLAAAGRVPFAVIDGEYDRAVAAEAAREMMRGSVRPDAIFVGNDHMAFAVMDTLRHDLGLRIPEDVSVVGYDDVPMAGWPSYALTTVRQPVDVMVSRAVAALLARIEGDGGPEKIRVEAPLVIRRSARVPVPAR